jgi:two-component system, cell cycle sensor histidine kinase and response regulator CckA
VTALLGAPVSRSVLGRLAPAVLAPLGLGWLALQGAEAGLYDGPSAVALVAAASAAVLAGLSVFVARAISRTDQARAEAQAIARDREEELATLSRSIDDAVIATDVDGRVTRMNAAAERWTGWPGDDARGRLLDQVLRIRAARSAGEAPGASKPASEVLVSRDGAERAVTRRTAHVRRARETARGELTIVRDASEADRERASLQRAQQRFARIWDSGILGIALGRLPDRLDDANAAFLRILGCSREELDTSPWTRMTPKEWRSVDETALLQVRSRGSSAPWEKELVRQSGERVHVLAAVAALDDGSDIVLLLDLTERKKAQASRARAKAAATEELAARKQAEEALRQTEEQLRQAQKMEAVGRLAGGIAHDFNNMLTVIVGYARTLADELPADDPVRGDLDEIRRAGQRAADLTRQLLAFSRQQVLSPRVFNLAETMAAMTRMLNRLIREDIELVMEPAADLGCVYADPGQIEQVLLNLVVNATDAMPTGGKLTIRSTNVDLDQAFVDRHLGARPGPHVLLDVTDTGSGMDRATQARIFEPFFTTKERGKGTGLGLATVYGIVQQSGGSIWVHSEPGTGTTFKVYLPRTDGAPDRSLAPIEKRIRGGSETILLVEDEEQVRQFAATILRRNGYEVLEAANCEEALSSCERRGREIALMLTDVVMPGVSGPDLAERLCRLYPGLRVLFMSGYAEDVFVRKGNLEIGNAFVPKPLSPDALLAAVRRVLDRSG